MATEGETADNIEGLKTRLRRANLSLQRTSDSLNF